MQNSNVKLNTYNNKKNKKYSFNDVIKKAGQYLSILEFVEPKKSLTGKMGKWKLKILCKQCNRIYETDLYQFMDGTQRCCESQKNKNNILRENFAYTPSEIEKKTQEISKEYICIDAQKYINSRSILKFEHKECQTITSMAWHKFKGGQRCKVCTKSRQSIAEENFKDILDHFNIKYETQYKFSECKDKQPLPFDFYIYKIDTLVEIDGEQHRRPSYGDKAFKEQQYRDQIKNKFIVENNLNLIRIEHDGWNDKVFQKLLDVVSSIFNKKIIVNDIKDNIFSSAMERRKKRIRDERPGYILLDNIFKGVDQSYHFLHEKCGTEFEAIYDFLRRGEKSCPICIQEEIVNRKWEKAKKNLEDKTQNRYTLNSKYKQRNNSGKWYVQCNSCNTRKWWNTQNIIRNKGGCDCLTLKKKKDQWLQNYNDIKVLFDKKQKLTKYRNLYQWLQKQQKDLDNNTLDDWKKSYILILLKLKRKVYSTKIRSFDEAKLFVRTLKLQNRQEYLDWCDGKLSHLKNLPKPYDIPKYPEQSYLEYIGINDWLGNRKPDKRFNKDGWMEFEKARKFIRSLQLKNIGEWKLYINSNLDRLKDVPLPYNIPKEPRHTYRDKG